MAKAIALSRTLAPQLDWLRSALVLACGFALILADRAILG